ncbi:MAG: hypothetical protein V4541_08120 [Bacteroidota bacterium]
MYRLLFSFLLLVSTMSCSAQKNTFGIVRYTVPDGYELQKNDNVLTYYNQNKTTGAYCLFFIYNTQLPGRPDPVLVSLTTHNWQPIRWWVTGNIGHSVIDVALNSKQAVL